MVKDSIRFVVAGLLGLLAAGMDAAYGQTAETPIPLVVEGRAGRIHIRVNPEKPTILQFTSPIRGVDRVVWKDFHFRREPGDVIVLHPEIAKHGVWGSFRVGTPNYEVSIVVHGTANPADALDIAEIRHRTELEAIEETIKARVALREAEVRREMEAIFAVELDKKDVELAKKDVELTKQAEEIDRLSGQLTLVDTNGKARGVLTEVLKSREPLPSRDNVTDSRGVLLGGLAWHVVGNLRILVLEFENRDSQDYDIGQLQLFDEGGTKDRVDELKIGNEDNAPALNGRVLANIPALGKIRAAILVSHPETVGESLILTMRDSDGDQPVMREKIPTFVFKEPTDKNEGRQTIYLKGLAGGLWLGDGSVESKLEATSLAGYGARLTFGFTRYLNLDTELAYASSGTADFSTVNRSAALFRVQAGGLLRFGEIYMATLRAGIGVQGARYRTQVPSTSDTTNTEIEMFSFFGGGVDVKLGDHFVAGIGVTFANSSDTRSLEAGIHLGYGWTP